MAWCLTSSILKPNCDQVITHEVCTSPPDPPPPASPWMERGRRLTVSEDRRILIPDPPRSDRATLNQSFHLSAHRSSGISGANDLMYDSLYEMRIIDCFPCSTTEGIFSWETRPLYTEGEEADCNSGFRFYSNSVAPAEVLRAGPNAVLSCAGSPGKHVS